MFNAKILFSETRMVADCETSPLLFTFQTAFTKLRRAVHSTVFLIFAS